MTVAGRDGWLTGRCLCGAVRFSAKPQAPEFGACHCAMCRRWSAGPFLNVECGTDVAVEDETSLGVYRSSEWGERCFCKACGTPLFWRLQSREHVAVSLEALDEAGDCDFAREIFIDERSPAYEFANDTRKMTGAEVFAEFAAGQEGDSG